MSDEIIYSNIQNKEIQCWFCIGSETAPDEPCQHGPISTDGSCPEGLYNSQSECLGSCA